MTATHPLNATRLFMLVLTTLSLSTGCPAAARGPDIGRLPVLTSDDPKAEVELREADALLARGDRAGAAVRYRTFIEKRPEDRLVPVAQLALGRMLLADHKDAEALALFSRVSKHREPAVAEQGRFYAGIALERTGQHEEAIAALSPMVGRTIEPADTALLLSTLADAYEHSDRIANAIMTLQTLSEDNVPDAERKTARSRISSLANEKASPADLRRLDSELEHESYAWRAVTLRAVRDADAAHDVERTRDLLDALKDEDVPFDDTLTAIAVRAERPSEANPGAVGAILPLSGRARKVGELALRGLMLAAGLPPTGPQSDSAPQLVFRDDAGDPNAAVEAVSELVTVHRVIAIIGPMDAQVAMAAGKRAQELSVPLIALTPAGDPTSLGSMVFRYFPTPESEARALVTEARARGAKRFAVLRPETPYGQAMSSALARVIAADGGEIVLQEAYPSGSTSFGAQAARFAKASFDALFIPDSSRQLALIAPALAAAGLWSTLPGQHAPTGGRAITLLAPSVAYDASLPRLAGRYLQGAVFAVPFDSAHAQGAAQDFVTRFKAQFGGNPDAFAAFAHDAYKLVRAAVEAGATSRQKLAEALTDTRASNLVAPASGFERTHEATHAVGVSQLVADGFEPLRTP